MKTTKQESFSKLQKIKELISEGYTNLQIKSIVNCGTDLITQAKKELGLYKEYKKVTEKKGNNAKSIIESLIDEYLSYFNNKSNLSFDGYKLPLPKNKEELDILKQKLFTETIVTFTYKDKESKSFSLNQLSVVDSAKFSMLFEGLQSYEITEDFLPEELDEELSGIYGSVILKMILPNHNLIYYSSIGIEGEDGETYVENDFGIGKNLVSNKNSDNEDIFEMIESDILSYGTKDKEIPVSLASRISTFFIGMKNLFTGR